MGPTTAPHNAANPLITSRRGQIWIAGEKTSGAYGTVQRAPLFASWEAPETVVHPYPLILIHGGGGQGTDWTGTPDGRPGWATRFVEAGFVVYVVDRPGHGRSPYHPSVVGEMGAPFPYEGAKSLFYPDDAATEQTQWSYSRASDSDEIDQLVAAMGPLPADLAESQKMDAERLGRLLDLTGPAVLVTHSAGAPAGWLTANERPNLVKAIVAVEPIGPAFAEFPGIGRLDWGLTAAPMTYEPRCESAAEAAKAPARTLRIPALEETPVAVLTGGASVFATFAPQIVDFLKTAGAAVEWIHLPEHGIEGNGHGLIFEANSDEIARIVGDWIATRIAESTLSQEPLLVQDAATA
jgi:pimeloyl-ACP methyl ester carboxylesterase